LDKDQIDSRIVTVNTLIHQVLVIDNSRDHLILNSRHSKSMIDQMMTIVVSQGMIQVKVIYLTIHLQMKLKTTSKVKTMVYQLVFIIINSILLDNSMDKIE
jgi:hypothetical protein